MDHTAIKARWRIIVARDTDEHGIIRIEAHRDVMSDPEGLVELLDALALADRDSVGVINTLGVQGAVRQQRREQAKAAATALIKATYGVPETTAGAPWLALAADTEGVLYAAPDDGSADR